MGIISETINNTNNFGGARAASSAGTDKVSGAKLKAAPTPR